MSVTPLPDSGYIATIGGNLTRRDRDEYCYKLSMVEWIRSFASPTGRTNKSIPVALQKMCLTVSD